MPKQTKMKIVAPEKRKPKKRIELQDMDTFEKFIKTTDIMKKFEEDKKK
jgi:hypothetical protein